LKVAIEASIERDEPLPHILCFGGPGLGKSSLAQTIANEGNYNIRTFMAPSIKSMADIMEILTKTKYKDIIFIDEIHTLDRKIEEMLYSAMEDFKVSVKLGNKQIVQIKVNPFCCIGATTMIGKVSAPLRDRFDLHFQLQYYNHEELATIIKGNSDKLNLQVESEDAIYNLAKRSRNIPRIANRLLRRTRDFAQIKNDNVITNDIVNSALDLEGIDEIGLTCSDIKYINALYEIYGCGPCGVECMSSTIGEDKTTVIDFIEPYLIRLGFIARTKSGRVLTADGMNYIIKKKLL
jgi:Holliday junction DNA helicase RuvB